MEKNSKQTSSQTTAEKEEPKTAEASTPASVGGKGYNMTKDIEENKVLTFLSYLGILCLVPLLAKKESKFAQFHAKQGLVLLIIMFIASVIGIIPILGWLVVFLVYIGSIILMIMGLIQVAQGEMKKLPIIGDFAEKLNL